MRNICGYESALHWSVVSGQWSVVSGQGGLPATAVSAWFEEFYREEVRRQ